MVCKTLIRRFDSDPRLANKHRNFGKKWAVQGVPEDVVLIHSFPLLFALSSGASRKKSGKSGGAR